MALNSYRSQRFNEALDFIKLFIVLLPPDVDEESAFDGWAMMAFAGTMVLFSVCSLQWKSPIILKIFLIRSKIYFWSLLKSPLCFYYRQMTKRYWND